MTMDAFVAAAVREARDYGLSGERATTRYVDCRAEFGIALLDDAQFEWLRAILSEPGVEEDDRIDAIDRRLFGRPIVA